MDAGIKAILYEAGPPAVFLESDIERGMEGIQNALGFLEMTPGKGSAAEAQVLKDSHWIRVPRRRGGIFLPAAKLGDEVRKGELIATVTDPLTDERHEIRADRDAVIVGMALPQVVLSGYGLFHVGTLSGGAPK
jgi:predicted deacylase